MIVEWRQRPQLDGLVLQWRGPNLSEGNLVQTHVGAIDATQIVERLAIVSGPPGTPAPPRLTSLQFVISAGDVPLTVGQEVELPDVPFDCTILSWTLTADRAGSAEVSIARASFESYPDFADISGTEIPTLVSDRKSHDTDLTTWTTALVKGDVLKARVENVETIHRLHVGLRVMENI